MATKGVHTYTQAQRLGRFVQHLSLLTSNEYEYGSKHGGADQHSRHEAAKAEVAIHRHDEACNGGEAPLVHGINRATWSAQAPCASPRTGHRERWDAAPVLRSVRRPRAFNGRTTPHETAEVPAETLENLFHAATPVDAMVGLPARNSPERARHLLEGSARFVRPQAVPEHGDDVAADVGIGNEIAVSEKVCRSPHLDDVDRVQVADHWIWSDVNIVASMSPSLAMLPNNQRDVASALSSRDTYKVSLSPGDGGMTAAGSGSAPNGRSGSEKTLKIFVTATSPSTSGATRTTLPMRNSRAGELLRA